MTPLAFDLNNVLKKTKLQQMSNDSVNLYFKDKQDDRDIMKMLNNNQKKQYLMNCINKLQIYGSKFCSCHPIWGKTKCLKYCQHLDTSRWQVPRLWWLKKLEGEVDNETPTHDSFYNNWRNPLINLRYSSYLSAINTIWKYKIGIRCL